MHPACGAALRAALRRLVATLPPAAPLLDTTAAPLCLLRAPAAPTRSSRSYLALAFFVLYLSGRAAKTAEWYRKKGL